MLVGFRRINVNVLVIIGSIKQVEMWLRLMNFWSWGRNYSEVAVPFPILFVEQPLEQTTKLPELFVRLHSLTDSLKWRLIRTGVGVEARLSIWLAFHMIRLYATAIILFIGNTEHRVGGVGRVQKDFRAFLSQQVNQQLLQFILLLFLLLFHSVDNPLVLFEQPLILPHEMPAHLLQVFLIRFKLLDLPIDRYRLHTIATAAFVEFNLVLTVLFDFTCNVFEEMLGSQFEIIIRVNILSVRVAYFPETVHIELADEGGKVAVFKVRGQNLLSEFADTFDVKRITGRGPADSLKV